MDRSTTTGGLRIAGWLLIGILAWVSPPIGALAAGTSVLLTFDTEDDRDALAIKELRISEPSTYYFTGQFVERHGKLVADLANAHTVGSHSYSHAHLAELDAVEQRKELLVSKMLLEEATGRAPQWFRAPYLEYDDNVMNALKELGFRYDSSDQERWTQQTLLLELPISNRDGSDQLVSDYDLFVREKLSDEAALTWLQERYQERVPTGRPMVFLMHPRIIAEHKQVLFDFMEYVRQNGGEFLSSDQWMERAHGAAPSKVGVWVDFSQGAHLPSQVVADVLGAGMTDVFLMARDPEGNDYFSAGPNDPGEGQMLFDDTLKALKQAGIRVHAWLPVFHNPYLAQLRPDWAMVGDNGALSLAWLSPSHPEARKALLDTLRGLVNNYDLDGIHLDYLRYPSLGYDFSPEALDHFATEQDLQDIKPPQLLSDHYGRWTDWRADQIAQFVKEVRALIRTHATGDMELSAALIADAATSFRSHEKFGQDYSRLARDLDIIIPMAYFKAERKPIEWVDQVMTAARFRIGDRQLLMGLPAYQNPGNWTLTQAQLAKAIAYSSRGSDGMVFYPYIYLFGRGADDWNMPAGSAVALKGILPDQNRATSSNSVVTGTPNLERSDVFDANRAETNADTEWRFAAVLVLASLGLVLLALKIWQTRRPGAKQWRREETRLLSAVDGNALDWRKLADEVDKESSVDADTFSKISILLRSVGASKIATFRQVQVCDAVSSAPLRLEEFVSDVGGNHQSGARTLRYLEESELLGHVRIEGSRISVTPLGREYLDRCKAEGYSRAFLAFLEERLRETLVLSCAHCRSDTLGHWFWEQFQCSGCGRDIQISNAPQIRRRDSYFSNTVRALADGGNKNDIVRPIGTADSRKGTSIKSAG